MGEPLRFSAWVLLSGFGGVLSGLAHLVLRTWSEGGGFRTLRQSLGESGRHVCTIMVIDFVGGCLLGLVGFVGGATEPGRLVALVNDRPLVGWTLVGVLGPVISGRLFTGGFVRGRYEQWFNPDYREDGLFAQDRSDVADQAWRLRAEAVASVEDRAWANVQATLSREADRLRLLVEQRLEGDEAEAELLVRLTRAYFRRPRRRATERVQGAIGECDDSPPGYQSEAAKRLGHALINDSYWEPVRAFLGR